MLFFIALSYLNPAWGESHLRGVKPWLMPLGDVGATVANAATLLWVVLLALLVEEIVFRGALLTTLARRWGTTAGILISSALFAAGHYDLISSFIVGVVLCLVALRTGSLWLPIVIHFVNNFLAMLASYSLNASGLQTPEASLSDFREGWWIGIGCLLLGVLILRLTLRAMFSAPTPAIQ